MMNIDSILLFAPAYTILTVGMAGVAGFVLGLLIRYGIILKQKRRILTLEDEMLTSHSRILSLEKKLSELRKDPNNSSEDTIEMVTKKKAELKVS
jgi:hypothetical protein